MPYDEDELARAMNMFGGGFCEPRATFQDTQSFLEKHIEDVYAYAKTQYDCERYWKVV